MDITIIGAGRAGHSFTRALLDAGHQVRLVHHEDAERVVASDLVLLTVPDDALADVARRVPARPGQVVAHAAGSRSLDVLAPHERRASLHPLAALVTPERGARRLRGATFAVDGDPRALELVDSLSGRALYVADEARTAYHAAAAVAANHLVALMGHVQRLAEAAGLAVEDFLGLARQSLEDVAEYGPAAALTGPASRGDWATIDAHLGAMADAERSTYVALAHAALVLAESNRSHTPV